MGHQRLGDIPKSQRWTTVVAVVADDCPLWPDFAEGRLASGPLAAGSAEAT